ncbi:MAG: hypothetical protein K2J15_07215, partial [Muribaculaceae bacterium]|nr:hypothetical protein [Muribaculaceae bacterium]
SELDSITAMVAEVAAQPQDEVLIVTSVREIYQTMPSKCFTPDFQKVIDGADAKSVRDGNEMGYFDYDILTNSQDPGDLRNVEIVNLTGSDGAVVKVTGERYGNDGFVMVTVRLIDNSYLIDDIEGLDGNSVKQSAQAYINGK